MTLREHMAWAGMWMALMAALVVGSGGCDALVPDEAQSRYEVRASRARLREFKKENQLSGICEADGPGVWCSGVTASGEPVVYRCNALRCEYVPRWAW